MTAAVSLMISDGREGRLLFCRPVAETVKVRVDGRHVWLPLSDVAQVLP